MIRPKRSATKAKPIIEISSDSNEEDDPDVERSRGADHDEDSVDSDFRVEGNKVIIVEVPASKKRGRPKKDSSASSKTKKPKIDDDFDGSTPENLNSHPWKFHELLAEKSSISFARAQNIVKLFQNDNTIPFMCRYRKDLIGNLTPEEMRNIKTCYHNIVNLQQKADSIINVLSKENQLHKEVKESILAAKTFEELEFLYAPYKPANLGSLAERAKSLGLQNPAENILYGNAFVRLEQLVNKNTEGLENVEKVHDGIINIMIHMISKNSEVLEELRRMQRINRIVIKCSKNTSTLKDKTQKKDSKQDIKKDSYKYEIYYNFENTVQYIKPHQVLAINRGEKCKVLKVKVIIPDRVKNEMKHFTRLLLLTNGQRFQLRNEMFEKSFEECYTKKLHPFLQKQVRSDLNDIANKASIEVFAKNLKQLLLMSPLKGEKILGIDPGFLNGCKLALINETTDLLETGVIYPHVKRDVSKSAEQTLVQILHNHGCKLIALGNGKACRETEFWLTDLFEKKVLDPSSIKYSIVSEQGASIYSCSETAKKEFPDLDVNLISAVSIARRLNDPLSEYVKIEPRHVGVGMYQHDVKEKELSEALNEVVTECVSFVGVDINTAGLNILKYISGLTTARAQSLIDYRLKNGPFTTRRSIKKVKSIGEKTFTQCAGFLRIDPRTIGGNISNYLDCTWVHPESYDVAKKIIEDLDFKIKNIGEEAFINKIKEVSHSNVIENYAELYQLPKERIQFILEALQREPFKDYRIDFHKTPLFKSGISKISELKLMDVVTGGVTNITHFGAFVDIGIEKDCLLHISKMNGFTLNIGDRIECNIIDIDIPKERVSLALQGMAI